MEEVNGKPAKVYSGTIDGKLLQQILNSTGAMNELTEAMGADMSEEGLANLSDLDVTIMKKTISDKKTSPKADKKSRPVGRKMARKAARLLKRELKREILRDGAHYEQSPMYHCILLDRLLDCINYTSAFTATGLFLLHKNKENRFPLSAVKRLQAWKYRAVPFCLLKA